MVMKLKNINCDETQKLKLWQNIKTQIVMNLKNSKCNEPQKPKLWLNKEGEKKTHIETKLKTFYCETLNNSNWDKTQKFTKLKIRQNSTQIVTKL